MLRDMKTIMEKLLGYQHIFAIGSIKNNKLLISYYMKNAVLLYN